MKYVGSKRGIAKYILEPILAGRKKNQWYIEPFVGGCNVIEHVTGNRIGNDSNYNLIAMWQALQAGWIPPDDITAYEYYFIKNNQHLYSPELICFVSHCCSYSGKLWAGYAIDEVTNRNYAREAKDHLLKQIKKLNGVQFMCKDYRDMDIPPKSIIYCDPPYRGTYTYGQYFNHRTFWNWARKMGMLGHRVYVSEYNAPKDFLCVREFYNRITIDYASRYHNIERLFKYSPSLMRKIGSTTHTYVV